MSMVYVTHDQAEAMVTSDRIVVMNKGRIEQVDAPFELYARPRTRFVAGFIGRTNFLEGRADHGDVDFGAFSVPRTALGIDGAPAAKVVVSLRPQAVHLLRQAPAGAANGHCGAPGRVQRRAYLGESWDYQVRLEGLEEPLRVSTRAQDVFEAGEAVYAQIDPAQLTVIR
jgi:ABC-type Fe3+/spermidine/putrescine transport system ATPase subunit